MSVGDLAVFQEIPERLLAKIFTRLKRAKLVKATEGISGGFVLSRRPENIRVVDVLDAVDADRTLFECAEIRRTCAIYGPTPPAWATSGPCRIHAFMLGAEGKLREFLASKSLADLAGEFKCKASAQFVTASEIWFRCRRKGRAGGGVNGKPQGRRRCCAGVFGCSDRVWAGRQTPRSS